MLLFVLLALVLAAGSAVPLYPAAVEARTPNNCAFRLEAALNYPQTPAAVYLADIADRFKCSGQVLYTANNVSFIQNFVHTYRVAVIVFDAFGNVLYPQVPLPLPQGLMGVPVSRSNINDPVVIFVPEKQAYGTQFIVHSPFGEAKYVTIGLPAIEAPFFK